MTEGQNAIAQPSTVYPLGRYLVLARLGRGGMADVYLALVRGPSGFNKLVVLKLLREHLEEDQEFLRMFLAEARLAARLNHPNIVQTYEVGIEDGRHCIVMEYLEGRSFAYLESATASEPIALNLSLRILADTLAGLHHAHECCDVNGHPLGLVHRDVSPHNVFITYDGQVKVLDFGIAKAADDGAHTKAGVFKGKLRYTAPERFCGEPSDRRSDIFSVGVMLWQLLAKRRLWSGMTDLALMQQLVNHVPIPSPRTVDLEIPEKLEWICLKALATSPDDRFQTALEMQDALEEFLSADSVGGTNRALGKFMGKAFHEKRAQFQRVIDEQTRAAAEIPLDVEFTGSVSRMRAQGLPVLASEGEMEAAASMGRLSSASRMKAAGGGSSTGSSPEVVASFVLASEPPPVMRRRWVGLVGVAVAVALVTSFILLFRSATARDARPSGGGSSAAVVSVSSGVSPPGSPTAAPVSAERDESLPGTTGSAGTGATALGGSASTTRALPVPVDPAAAKRGAAPPVHAPVSAALRPRTSVSGSEARAGAPVLEAPSKREVDCSSPYFIDDQGMKKIRAECL